MTIVILSLKFNKFDPLFELTAAIKYGIFNILYLDHKQIYSIVVIFQYFLDFLTENNTFSNSELLNPNSLILPLFIVLDINSLS